MGIARSTYYDAPKRTTDDTALVEAMSAIKDESEADGWRRIQAALGQRGRIVNHKKLKRLRREHGLNARRRRRYVATTDSDHDQPIFPNRTRDMIVAGPDQLWVADLTYVAIAVGFVYVAVIMDAWSRRIIGYAMSRRIDARLTLAALIVRSVSPDERCPFQPSPWSSNRGPLQFWAERNTDWWSDP